MLTEDAKIQQEAFDREYGLVDLLPTALIAELAEPLGMTASLAVMLPDGTPYFGRIPAALDPVHALSRITAENEAEVFLFATGAVEMAICPLKHEMELVGLLLLQTDKRLAMASPALLAKCLTKAFTRLMNANYREKLTFGLHARVVIDSYEQLKIKAAELARSEEMYRHLAENLEIEVRRKSEEIRQTQIRLMHQEKLAAVGQLSAGMAHEINNPIGFIISNLNSLRNSFEAMTTLVEEYEALLLRLGQPSPHHEAIRNTLKDLRKIENRRKDLDIEFLIEDGVQLIAESLTGAHRIQAIVQNLRDFAHPSIETAESVSLNDCLDTTLSVLAHQVPEGVAINRAYGPIPAIACHLREINQAFYHILHNALLAVGDQGTIDLRTGTFDGQAQIDIRDNGPGICETDINRIFDPFFTTRDIGQGIGLGLHTAYHVVKRHGGTIDVQSGAGQGTTFSIRLPLTPSKHGAEKHDHENKG